MTTKRKITEGPQTSQAAICAFVFAFVYIFLISSLSIAYEAIISWTAASIATTARTQRSATPVFCMYAIYDSLFEGMSY